MEANNTQVIVETDRARVPVALRLPRFVPEKEIVAEQLNEPPFAPEGEEVPRRTHRLGDMHGGNRPFEDRAIRKAVRSRQ